MLGRNGETTGVDKHVISIWYNRRSFEWFGKCVVRLQPAAYVFNVLFWLLWCGCEDQLPVKVQLRVGVWLRLFNVRRFSKLLSSTNLFERIWVTSFGGAGEKPSGNTHKCCRTGIIGKDGGTVGTSPVAMLEGKGATEETGGENVETNDGRNKFGLPDNVTTGPVVESPHQKQPKPKLKNLSWMQVVRECPPIVATTLGENKRGPARPQGLSRRSGTAMEETTGQLCFSLALPKCYLATWIKNEDA